MSARDSALRSGAAAVLLLSSLVAVSWPQVATAADDTPSYAFTDLGANYFPVSVNRSNTVVGTVTNPGTGAARTAVWSDGTRTTLTAPTDGLDLTPSGITDDGTVVATEYHGATSHIVIWTSPTDPHPTVTDLPGYGNALAWVVDEASGNIAAEGSNGSGSPGYAIIDRTGAVLRALPERTHAYTTSAHTYLGSDNATNFIGNIATGKTTSLDIVTGWMASDGSVVGEVYGDSATILRTADGTDTTLNIDGGRQVNARHDVISSTQVLFAGAATPVESSSLMPTGWTAPTMTGLGDNGSLVGYATAPDGDQHGFLLRRSAVAGTVYGVHCTSSSCSRDGIKDQLVLLKGTTAAGKALTATTRTDSKGRYDLDAPAGTYQVGPAFSGSQDFIGSAFDPETYTVQVGSAAATDKDFEVCAGAASGTTTGTSLAQASAADATKATACESVYTVTMQASLPAGTVVDPSSYARYNRNSSAGDPDYRDSFGRADSILHSYPFTSKAAGVAREYPACLTEAQLKKLDGKNIDWYSEFEGGSSLGQLKVTLAVLQGKGSDAVRVVGEPTVSNPKVTKVWHYRYKDSGKYVHDSCQLDEQAKPVVVPIAGAEPGSSGLESSQFAIAVAWAFPYDPTGLSLRTEPTGIAAILHYFGQLGETLYKGYEKLPEWGKLFVDTVIGFAIGGKYVKAVKKSADLISKFAPALKYLPKLAGVSAEALHRALAARDFVYYVAGYAGDYPIMGSVVRGNFTPHYCSWHGVKSDFVCGSIISLGAQSAKFPDIELKIRRDAKEKTASEGGDTVYTGKYLPWHGISAGGSIVSFNPFSHNGNYLLSDTNGHSYHSGANAVTAITDATAGHDALKPLERGVEEDATPVADFGTILSDLPDPSCNTDADADHDRAHTICYYIHDGRP